ncbi:MAG: M61 family metallopeptidase [Woeseiaceae bacterium]
MSIHYTVASTAPESHFFDVMITVPEIPDREIELVLPVWIPGSYMVRDYARHVMTVEAVDRTGQPVTVSRSGKSRWRVQTGIGETKVSLVIYGWDLSVRGAHIDRSHAYFNGACLLPEVKGHAGPFRLTVLPPEGLPESAVVATSMRPDQVDAKGFGDYMAADYDELLDHPFEIADQQCIAFEAAAVPHRFFIRGTGGFDEARFRVDCQKICEAHHALLGTPTELDRYDFLSYALDKGYGGLEHRWSSSLALSRDALPQAGQLTDERAYRTLLGLISHEYFHLWNVKRLKPAAFVPMDMSQEVHTTLLWVFEGVTSYYDDLILARSGVVSEEVYLQLLAENLTRILRTPGRFRQTLADSSFDAWTKFYKQDENAPNAIISYYAKGALAALALDLKLRAETETTLDAVMRECWQRFYLTDGAGIPEDGFERVASELADRDLSSFFDHAIRSTSDIDVAELFKPFGIQVQLHCAADSSDTGGIDHKHRRQVDSGIRFDPGNSSRIRSVIAGSAAADAGLSAGDQVVALNGRKAGRKQFDLLMQSAGPGDTMAVHAFRRDLLAEYSLTLRSADADTAVIRIDPDASDDAIARRRAWLALGPGD